MAFGKSSQFLNERFLLNEQLSGMGDYLSKEVGSLAWCEALAMARALDTANNFVQLMANQLSPAEASVLLDEWKTIYNIPSFDDGDAANLIEIKQEEFGTAPTITNLQTFLNKELGSIFINLQWAPELQPLATTNPQSIINGSGYITPLAVTYVYVWQPRDNQDNLLMTNNTFTNTVENYQEIADSWSPSYTSFQTMNLGNRGFQDGYCNNHNGINFNNYLDGYNVISGTSGSTTITGVGTAFLIYPNGQDGDFYHSTKQGYNPPIQVVDDAGVLQTYYVSSVVSNTSLTITTPLINNITSRTYRCLGIVLDTNGALDGGMLFN